MPHGRPEDHQQWGSNDMGMREYEQRRRAGMTPQQRAAEDAERSRMQQAMATYSQTGQVPNLQQIRGTPTTNMPRVVNSAGDYGPANQPPPPANQPPPSQHPPNTPPPPPTPSNPPPPNPPPANPPPPPPSGGEPPQRPPFEGQPQDSRLGNFLQNQVYQQPNAPQFQGYQQYGQQGPSPTVTQSGVPTYQPGVNPFNFQQFQGNYAGPQVGQQGQFQAQSGVNPQLMSSILNTLGNPSRYGQQEAQNTFDMLNRQLEQTGDVARQRVQEEAARTGFDFSTSKIGRLGDLESNLANSRRDFATNIAMDQARTYGSDMAQAVAQAMGYSGMDFGQQAQQFGMNQGAQAQRFGQELAAGQFGLGQNAQNFGQALAGNQFNQGLAETQFGADMASRGMLNQINQQQFGQQLAGQQFNRDTAQQNFGQQAAGFQMNEAARQGQANRLNQAIANLMGFGQQGFENQLSTAQFNAAQDNQFVQQMLAALGLI